MTVIETDAAFDRAYRALSHAADRVGAWQYAMQLKAHQRKTRRPWGPGDFNVVTGHDQLVQGMADLGARSITTEEAMALLHFGESAEALSQARKWEASR